MRKSLYVNRWIQWNESGIQVYPSSLESPHWQQPGRGAQEIYEGLDFQYPKFFKMDPPSQWAWLCAEWLLSGPPPSLKAAVSPDRVAMIFGTASGCLEADIAFYQSMETLPRPALFVYTLPNIMMGELSIRHGFKGEQLCLVEEELPLPLVRQYAEDLLFHRGMEACLLGWVEVFGERKKIGLFWVSQNPSPWAFQDEVIRKLIPL